VMLRTHSKWSPNFSPAYSAPQSFRSMYIGSIIRDALISRTWALLLSRSLYSVISVPAPRSFILGLRSMPRLRSFDVSLFYRVRSIVPVCGHGQKHAPLTSCIWSLARPSSLSLAHPSTAESAFLHSSSRYTASIVVPKLYRCLVAFRCRYCSAPSSADKCGC
jgi:hypothetical protein